jgi:hypothetical protein
MAELFDPVQKEIALQKRRVGGVHQRVFPAVKKRAAALLFKRLFEPLERDRDAGRCLVVLVFGISIGGCGHDAGKGRYIIGPGPVQGALDRVLGMQPRRDRFVQILVDGVRFEQRHSIVDAQRWDFLVRRDGEEPIGPIVRLNMAQLELGILFAKHDSRALHPRAGLEADQHVFCHGVLLSLM